MAFWHSETDMPLRKAIIDQVRCYFESNSSPLTAMPNFPDYVRKLELLLYSNSPSREEYKDYTTLFDRINNAISLIKCCSTLQPSSSSTMSQQQQQYHQNYQQSCQYSESNSSSNEIQMDHGCQNLTSNSMLLKNTIKRKEGGNSGGCEMGKEMEELNIHQQQQQVIPEVKMEQTERNNNDNVMIPNMTNLTTSKRENTNNTKFDSDIIDISLNKGDSNQSNSSFSSQDMLQFNEIYSEPFLSEFQELEEVQSHHIFCMQDLCKLTSDGIRNNNNNNNKPTSPTFTSSKPFIPYTYPNTECDGSLPLDSVLCPPCDISDSLYHPHLNRYIDADDEMVMTGMLPILPSIKTEDLGHMSTFTPPLLPQWTSTNLIVNDFNQTSPNYKRFRLNDNLTSYVDDEDPLVHAYKCHRDICSFMCIQLRRLLSHVRKCERRKHSGCTSCMWLGMLLNAHSFKCCDATCPLPCCKIQSTLTTKTSSAHQFSSQKLSSSLRQNIINNTLSTTSCNNPTSSK